MSIPFDRPQLDALLTGNTATVATPGGAAHFYYGSDGRAAARLADGTARNGRWQLESDAYRVQWQGAEAGRTQVIRSAEGWQMRDAASGAARGVLTQLRPGNPEGL